MKQRVVILGAGVAGVCSALYAARAGHDVTVVDRDAPDRFTTSHGNAGLLTPSHIVPLAAPGVVAQGLRWMRDPESPFYVQPRLDADLIRWGWRFWRSGTAAHVERSAPVLRDLNLASRGLYVDLAREADDFGLALTGCLMVCRTEAGLAHEAATAAHARALGLEAETLDAGALARAEPDARFDAAGAVLFPQDGYLDPGRFVASATRRAEEAGARFVWNADVTGWQTEGRRAVAVDTTAGRLEADAFVAAAGAWTPEVLRPLGLRLPMQAGKGYHVHLPAEALRLRHSLILVEGRVAVTPMGSQVRVAGTMEIAGNGSEVRASRVRGIVRTLPQYLPDVPAAAFDQSKAWAGHRPCSPDGLPYVGAFARVPNVLAATGHAMMGLSLGPVTGQAIAALLSDEAPPVSLDRLSPDRFS